MCFYVDGAETGGEVIRQSEINLRERRVGCWSHICDGDVVTLIFNIDQIDDYRGRRFVLAQLEIGESGAGNLSQRPFARLRKLPHGALVFYCRLKRNVFVCGENRK
jgi:hypothetical protein